MKKPFTARFFIANLLLIALLLISTIIQSSALTLNNSVGFGSSTPGNIKDFATSNLKEQKSLLEGSSTVGKISLSESSQNQGELSGFEINNDNSTEMIIGLNKGELSVDNPIIRDSNLSRFMNYYHSEIVNQIIMGGEVDALVVRIQVGEVISLAKEAKDAGFARYVEPNVEGKLTFIPNDPYWGNQWGSSKIKADFAWNTTIGNRTILVAVIDTGIDYTHPDLSANYVPLGFDFINNDSYPMDDFGHGTHCAGIIAAQLNNSKGIAGLAQVRIMAEKVFDAYGDTSSVDVVAKGIIHAVDNGANILSCSFGFSYSSSALYDAVEYAVNHGVLVVAAAGNSESNTPEYPGAFADVVCVSATDSADLPASFTTYGDWVDVAAPGVNIYSTMPTRLVILNFYGYSMNYAYMNGTSMACPMVAGVAALIWSRFPNMTTNAVRAQLQTTCDDKGVQGFDSYYGWGRINAQNAVEQSPPAHDVEIFGLQTWFTYIKRGDATKFDIIVYNRGQSVETGVLVQLLVNGSKVNSTSITSLSSGASANVLLSWNSTVVGNWNITAYLVPVEGETVLQNNQISKNFITIVDPNIYIRVDGSVDPISAPISNVRNASYSLSGDINASIVIERDNIVVDGAGHTLRGVGNGTGLFLNGRNNVTITGMTLEEFACGVDLEYSTKNVVNGNKIIGTGYLSSCIKLVHSDNNTVSSNRLNGGNEIMGIDMVASDFNNVTGNNITLCNLYGIAIAYSVSNVVVANNVTSGYCGIEVYCSSSNILRNNTVSNNKYNFETENYDIIDTRYDVVNDIDISNTVDSQPIYYWVNKTDRTIPTDAGYVALINCRNITVQNIDLKNNYQGIFLVETINSTIANNKITRVYTSIYLSVSSSINIFLNKIEASKGVELRYSSNNTIYKNSITHGSFYGIGLVHSSKNDIFANRVTNSGYGVYIYNATNNSVYHNDFIFNSIQVNSDNFSYPNVWDNGYPSGGNYWSTHNSTDANADGICDMPYTIYVNATDRYPLIYPYGAPYISINSPANTTYGTSTVPLNFTVIKPAMWTGYSLNNQNNVTITGNTTLTALPQGLHRIAIYANDTAGNMGASETTYFTIDFTINIYTITVTQTSNGVIAPKTSTVHYGGSQRFNITANVGYRVVDVLVDNVSQGAVSSYTFGNVTTNHSITATFGINTYAITVTQGPNGVIAPGTTTVNYGSNQTFTVTPNSGYHIASIRTDANSVTVTSPLGQTVSFTNVTVTHTITAAYAIDTCTISASASANGAISPSGSVGVNFGGSQAFIITANAGYHVADVLMDGSSVGAISSYTFSNVTAAHSISASFAINSNPISTYSITVTQGNNGVISPGTTTVNSGGSQTFTFTANVGYCIASLMVDGNSVAATSAYTFSTVTASHTISATFKLLASPVTNLTAVTNTGVTVSLGINGNITSTEVSNVTISTNQSAMTTSISFTITGTSGTTGFGNITIPKSAVLSYAVPEVFIDNQPAQNQGYAEDSGNYYVWYTTHFSTHKISIVFNPGSSIPEFPPPIVSLLFIALTISLALALRQGKREIGKS